MHQKMHPALQLTEILLNIFSHWRAPYYDFSDATCREPLGSADLAALARTCRLFKEPALDVLWSVLTDLTPLALCLPQACYPATDDMHFKLRYRFQRPIEQAEWDILRRYTHRIRSVHDIANTFFWYDVEDFLSPPDPLFPNLRHLRYVCSGTDPTPVLCRPLPSLVSVTYKFSASCLNEDTKLSQFESHLEQFPGGSPMLGQLTLQMAKPEVVIDLIVSEFICGWLDPRIVTCYLVTLNTSAFKHLSRASNLTQLSFTLDSTLSNAITRSDALCFNRLEVLALHSRSLVPVSEIFSRIQLPAIAHLCVTFDDTPTKQNLASLLEALQTSGACSSIIALAVMGSIGGPFVGSDDELVRDDLLPFMTFKNLRCLNLDIQWHVGLVDDDLVELVSEWPHLERLIINRRWGWRQTPESRGITPNGVLRLLQTCPSLVELVVAVDTRSSGEALLEPSPDDLTLDAPRIFFINVIDSTIEEASVPRMVAFFTHLLHLMPSNHFTIGAWTGFDRQYYHEPWWKVVFEQVQGTVGQNCILY